jgi:glycosyltransferase involved in cell wall biosynthesis
MVSPGERRQFRAPVRSGSRARYGLRRVRTTPHDPRKARLGLYVDVIYRKVEHESGARYSTDRAFILFASEVASHFESLTVFGRVTQALEDSEYVLGEGTRVVALPFYSNLRRLGAVGRAAAGTVRAFARGLRDVDTVWVFGPHVFGATLAVLALLRRRKVVLGVRQDTVEYSVRRAGSGRWRPVLVAVRLLDLVDRLVSRLLRTTVVGDEIGRRYGAPRKRLLVMTASLVPESAIVTAPPARDWSGTLELLTVGRIEPEKNPLLVADLLAELDRRSPGRYRLTWIGRGGLEEELRARAAELGVADLLELAGYVRFGPALLERYRRAHVFVHVSLTEGLPQVLLEAQASAVPVVATDVGSVRAALDGGSAGVLVPPRDLAALVAGVERLASDEALRDRVVARGLELVRDRSLEREAARVAEFIAGA